MNGFVLIFYKNGSNKNKNNYINLAKGLEQRGGIDCNFLIEDNLVLGSTNSKDKLYDNQSSNLLIIGDYRIDNKTDLIDALQLSNNVSDNEIIHSGYIEWGNDLFEKIEGPFSIIIYKKKEKEIIAARDTFGQRPLLYFDNDECLVLCPEIQQLYDLEINLEINKTKAFDFITNTHKKDNKTLFRNINKIHGGHMLSYKSSALVINKYYNLRDKLLKNKQSHTKEFINIFSAVILGMLHNNHGKISSTLSGGLDSSSISILLNKLKSGQDHHTISVNFGGLDHNDFAKTDEQEYIDEVNSHINSNHSKLSLDYNNSGPLGKETNYIYNKSFPDSTINGYMHKSIYDCAYHNESNFLYDGLFGDEVISHGMFRLPELLRKLKILTFFKELYYLKKLKVISSIKRQVKNFIIKPFLHSITSFDYSLGYEEIVYSKSQRQFLIVKNFRKFISDVDEQISFFESGTLEFALEQMDIMSSAYNVEGVYPFLDKRIVEYTINVQTDLKLRKGITRYYFKESMKNILPKKIYQRNTKANISPYAYNQISENLDRICKKLISSDSGINDVVDVKALVSFIKNSNNPSSSYIIFYNLISFDEWLKYLKEENVFKH